METKWIDPTNILDNTSFRDETWELRTLRETQTWEFTFDSDVLERIESTLNWLKDILSR